MLCVPRACMHRAVDERPNGTGRADRIGPNHLAGVAVARPRRGGARTAPGDRPGRPPPSRVPSPTSRAPVVVVAKRHGFFSFFRNKAGGVGHRVPLMSCAASARADLGTGSFAVEFLVSSSVAVAVAGA